jgi:5-methylcytosine-specific restriction endonuclease McrA
MLEEYVVGLPLEDQHHCWFCGRQLRGKASRHHLLPKRFRGKAACRKSTVAHVIVLAHQSCHQVWHMVYDQGVMYHFRKFLEWMRETNFGARIFPQPPLAASG